MNMVASLRGFDDCRCKPLALSGTVYNPTNYDIITVGGKQYTADQLLDKQLVAAGSVTIFHSDLKTPIRTVKAGQVIGYVYSYRKADQSPNGQVSLELYDNRNYDGMPYWVTDDSAISSGALKDQGTLTVAQQQQAYQDQQDANDNPITHFLKQYGLKILLIGGAIYGTVQLGKAVIEKKL